MSLVGLDVGTSRIKAVRFDDAWQAVDVASDPSDVVRQPGGGREQDMDGVWRAAANVLATVVRRSPDPVRLVAVTGQGDGCWLVDAAGQPVRPAMLWNDSRAGDVLARWQADGRLGEAFQHNGCQGAPGLPHAQLAWLREHEPAAVERAATLLSCGSWIHQRLTGRRVLDVTEAANPFFDARARAYDPTLLELFGLPELSRLLPEVVDGPDRVAPALPDVAAELGLAPGTPVCLAPYDVPATAIGTGVVRTDESFAVLGTTLCVGTVADNPHLDRPPNGMSLPGTDPATWLIAYATMIGTEVLDWTAALLGLPDAAAVVELAGTSTRPDLPTVLPYLSAAGERSPFLDPTIRGAITGLDTSHTPADVARATVTGLSLAVADCLRASGRHPTSLALSGGGAASRAWCRAICDATSVPVELPDVSEVGARGAVISGAVAAGLVPDLDAALRCAIGRRERLEPDATAAPFYADAYSRLVTLRERVGEGPHQRPER